MKILKEGRPQKGWSIEATCTGAGNKGGGCGAVLLVEQPDLFKTYSSARDETTMYITFKCAACGVKTDIPDMSWPSREIWAIDIPDERDWEAKQEKPS